MESDNGPALSLSDDVMAAIDGDGAKQLVIADLSRDSAWIAVALEDAVRVQR